MNKAFTHKVFMGSPCLLLNQNSEKGDDLDEVRNALIKNISFSFKIILVVKMLFTC